MKPKFHDYRYLVSLNHPLFKACVRVSQLVSIRPLLKATPRVTSWPGPKATAMLHRQVELRLRIHARRQPQRRRRRTPLTAWARHTSSRGSLLAGPAPICWALSMRGRHETHARQALSLWCPPLTRMSPGGHYWLSTSMASWATTLPSVPSPHMFTTSCGSS